jgi:UDP-N-acetylmuramoyl-tripeptide--D-alanyl-D-alanine ligase
MLEKFDLVNTAKKAGKTLIVVENTLPALQNTARVYLEKFPNLLKIAITGSSGKTTTKEITAAIVGCVKNTVMSRGNLNSETGLCLSAFEVRSCHEAGVFEIGMNRPGETEELAAVLKPNIALITNIGSAHIGILGTKQAIAEEKKTIFNFLSDNDIAFIPQNDEYRDFLAEGVKGKVRFYGTDAFTQTRSLGLEGTEIQYMDETIHFALPGGHNLENASAAAAIAQEIPADSSAVKRGLESVQPLFGRSEILSGRTTVLRDCNNANPESAARSIEFCDSLEWQGRRVYVIADMLELGANSPAEHEKIGGMLSCSKADMVFLFGSETKISAQCMARAGGRFFHTSDIHELSSALDCYVQTGDLVLLKGSRGCALERLSGMLTGVPHAS